mgnify:CR=1 FL=1
MNVFEKRMNKKGNEFDAFVIGLIATFIFYGVLWVIFSLGLGNPYHRIFILLGGSFPEEQYSFSLFLLFFGHSLCWVQKQGA